MSPSSPPSTSRSRPPWPFDGERPVGRVDLQAHVAVGQRRPAGRSAPSRPARARRRERAGRPGRPAETGHLVDPGHHPHGCRAAHGDPQGPVPGRAGLGPRLGQGLTRRDPVLGVRSPASPGRRRGSPRHRRRGSSPRPRRADPGGEPAVGDELPQQAAESPHPDPSARCCPRPPGRRAGSPGGRCRRRSPPR